MLNIIFLLLFEGEDALLAVDSGVSGIVISNHGGRQLDTVPATVGPVGCFSTVTVTSYARLGDYRAVIFSHSNQHNYILTPVPWEPYIHVPREKVQQVRHTQKNYDLQF